MDLPAFADMVIFAGLVAGAAVYIVSQIRRQRATELHELAETRGSRIEDLETEIRGLEKRLATLEGAYAGLQALKVTEIADEVVNRLAAAHAFGNNGS